MTKEKTIYDLLNDVTTDLSDYDVQQMDELQQKRMETMAQQIEKEHPKTKEIEKREKDMKIKNLLRKPAAVAALVLCVGLSGTAAIAATGGLEGFFTDIFGKNGAVVGTEYKQATEEINMNIAEATHQLTVELTMVDPNKVPYSEFEQFGIARYEIVDMNGNILVERTASELADLADGKVFAHIPLDSLPNGEYKLIVSEMVGSKKADQPLILYGNWDGTFTK